MTDIDLEYWYAGSVAASVAPTVATMLTTVLTKRRAVDHCRVRSALCRSC